MRLTPYVGSLSPGRFADVVLLSDLDALTIEKVWADGTQVSEGKRYTGEVPRIDWPHWATNTINIRRKVTARDFALPAAPGRATMKAAVIRPFHWHPDFYTLDMPVRDGEVQRDPSENITKFAIVDRFSGEARISKMFWRGCGPRTPETALACSVAHDKHNVWVVGSSDAAMARAVNALVETQGGWALVRGGELVATVRFEIGGLMTCRPAEELDAEMQQLYAQAGKVDWMYEPTFRPRWYPGFPERLMFATLTCAPWTWVLVAPCEEAPQGFINVQTGKTHPVVW
jgi:adenine deaminase